MPGGERRFISFSILVCRREDYRKAIGRPTSGRGYISCLLVWLVAIDNDRLAGYITSTLFGKLDNVWLASPEISG